VAAERAKKAADQAEQLLKRTAEAADRIGAVGQNVEQISKQASATANQLVQVGANVERGLDPLEPLEIGFSFLLPLPEHVANSTEYIEKSELQELVEFRKKLDSVRLSINPDDESGPSIRLCRACPHFPPEGNRLPHLLLTERYETWFGFYRKEPIGKGLQLKGEPFMAFWVEAMPEIEGIEDDANLAPDYFPRSAVINFSFKSQVVKADHIYSPRSIRSVRDLLGTRMVIELRPFSGGWLPESVRRATRPSLISMYLPGGRELQFHDRNLTRVERGRQTFWVFDFPNTMKELQRKFVP
jgi:hypothetical protein